MAARIINQPRIIAVTCFGLLFLPLLFVQARDQKSKRAVEIVRESEKTLWSAGNLEARRAAVQEMLDVSVRLSSMHSMLAGYGLKDYEPEIRVISAIALGNLGLMARSASGQLVILRTG